MNNQTNTANSPVPNIPVGTAPPTATNTSAALSGASSYTPGSFNITPEKPARKKNIALLAVLLLLIGVSSGLFIVLRPIIFKSEAWDCEKYTFSVSDSGAVTVRNDSAVKEAVQKARVYIDNNLVATYDVPALAPGESKTLGTVEIPSAAFTWQVQGTSDCSNTGRVQTNVSLYQCKQIKAFNASGVEISAADLANSKEGDIIRFVAIGSGNAINYSQARFSVNGGTWLETTSKVTGSSDYYIDYTIPTGVTTFTIASQLKAPDGAWY